MPYTIRHAIFVFLVQSEGFTVDNLPPLSDFLKKRRGGGLSGRKFFVKVFLSKKFPALRARKKKEEGYLEGGGVLYSETLWYIKNLKDMILKWKVVVFFLWVFTPPLKWLNLPFIIYLCLYWCYQPKNCFGKAKVCLFWEKKTFFHGKPKMIKKFKFENLKIPSHGQISGFGIFKFSNSNVSVIFGFPSKTFLFLKANIYFCLTKNKFWAHSINRKEDILYNHVKVKFSHFGGINTYILLGKKHRHLSVFEIICVLNISVSVTHLVFAFGLYLHFTIILLLYKFIDHSQFVIVLSHFFGSPDFA